MLVRWQAGGACMHTAASPRAAFSACATLATPCASTRSDVMSSRYLRGCSQISLSESSCLPGTSGALLLPHQLHP